MAIAHNLGFPPIGAGRELKRATEGYWGGKVSRDQLLRTGAELRAAHWRLQRDAGLDLVPVNDFSFYDRVLDTCAMVGAVPERYGWSGATVDLDTYFAMARGREAKAVGLSRKPGLVGPVSFLLLGKARGARVDRLELLDGLLAVYAEVLGRLVAAGATWVQLDEPTLVLDRTPEERSAFRTAYRVLSERAPGLKILLATYFDGLHDNLDTALELPVAGLHVDLGLAPAQLDALLGRRPAGRVLSLGVVDRRTSWKADLAAALAALERASGRLGVERVWVAPSCSLLHVPVDLELERKLDPELKGWLAFAKQKLGEVVALARALRDGRRAAAAALEANARALASRRASSRIHNPAVKRRAAAVTEQDLRRAASYRERRPKQVRLPLYPTTTIGSFPQTAEVRAARRQFLDGKTTAAEYERFIPDQIERTLKIQEDLGLDVLVHGEFERNDMVEYFGEQLQGFAFTEHGWVQSYGSRYVKPPIIYGDVSRPNPMTVAWSTFAQSKTARPVKGMLTGPVTILQWSFVRDDQPRAETAKQLALAISDEVLDLERAGIGIIQIDEPALREGLPLRRADWRGYLDWAVNAFRLATSRVQDATQIHTHMCYSEFNDVIRVIERMDADVISIENARSGSELLEAFRGYKYPNEIGPGVYDIHSPRVPATEEIAAALERMREVLEDRQIWVNPDCGLKTRGWDETLAALRHAVEAARRLRAAGTRLPAGRET